MGTLFPNEAFNDWESQSLRFNMFHVNVWHTTTVDGSRNLANHQGSLKKNRWKMGISTISTGLPDFWTINSTVTITWKEGSFPMYWVTCWIHVRQTGWLCEWYHRPQPSWRTLTAHSQIRWEVWWRHYLIGGSSNPIEKYAHVRWDRFPKDEGQKIQ